jgi:hypothetical protein
MPRNQACFSRRVNFNCAENIFLNWLKLVSLIPLSSPVKAIKTSSRLISRMETCPLGGFVLNTAAVQPSVISFQTNCELNTTPMLLTGKKQYSVSIKSKQKLKGGMTYV